MSLVSHRRLSGLLLASAIFCHLTGSAAAAGTGPFQLDLPERPVSQRVARVENVSGKKVLATMEGPGCIRHLQIIISRPAIGDVSVARAGSRGVILRIYFDDSEVPQVESPLGDFFGVMHGLDWYPVNTEFLSVKAWNAYNCYFEMPFAKRARIEVEVNGSRTVYLHADWHHYPEQELKEQRRFCARWRRENPAQAYGEEFLLLDAVGAGQLVGFIYGIRLRDDKARWSHGGADQIYIDGDSRFPSVIRGTGGEDTFGTSYGGTQHPPETHLYAGMPHYSYEEIGRPYPAQHLVGYRFFTKDSIRFEKSVHMRFGSMANDISGTVYWYQSGALQPFTKLPAQAKIEGDQELKREESLVPLPDDGGTWWTRGPLDNPDDRAIQSALQERLNIAAPFDNDGWKARQSYHGFIEFNHLFRPHEKGVATHFTGKVAVAHCVLEAPRDLTAKLRIAWDDRLVLHVNDSEPRDLGTHDFLRPKEIEVPLRKGPNQVRVTLTNTTGTNHGAWAFTFQASAPDGTRLLPKVK